MSSATLDAAPEVTRPGPPRPVFRAVVAAVTVLLCAAVAVPLVVMTVRVVVGDFGTDGSLGAVLEAATSGETLAALRNTLLIVVLAGGVALLVGAVFAWLNERTDARLGWLAEVLPLVSMFVPALASAIGWVFLFDPQVGLFNATFRDLVAKVGVTMSEGPLDIYSWPGLLFAYTLYLVPFAYLAISSGLQSLDPALEEAAKVSGSGVGRTFLRVVLPSLRPSLGSAVLVLTAMGFAMFSIPVIIGTRADIDVLPVKIVYDVTHSYPMDLSSAMGRSLLLLAVVVVSWLLQRRLVGHGTQAYATVGGKPSRQNKVRLGRWRWPARAFMVGYLMLASVVPFLSLLAVSLQGFWAADYDFGALTGDNYRALLERPAVRDALRNSLLFALVAASVTLVGTFLVTHVTGLRGGRVGSVVDGIMKLPAAITHIVIAIALIICLGGPPARLAGTALIVMVAYVVMYLPQASFYVTAGMQQVGRPLIEAGVVSGAGPGRISGRILAPLMVPSMLAAWSLIFVLMMGDVTGSALVASSRTPVVGFVMLDQWTTGRFPTIAALGVVMTLVSSLVVSTVLFLRSRYRTGG